MARVLGPRFLLALAGALAPAACGSTGPADETPEEEGPGATLGRQIYGLAHGDGRFVAVGAEQRAGGTSVGVVYVSTDGSRWSRAASDPRVVFWDVTWGAGRFVAVGTGYTSALAESGHAAVSPDGRTWTVADVPAGAPTGCAYGNGVFLAAGKGQHLRSRDGLVWEMFGPKHELDERVVFAGGRFVSWYAHAPSGAAWVSDGAEGEGLVVHASDGEQSLVDLRAVGDRLLATLASGEPSGGRARVRSVSSSDGLHWAAAALASPVVMQTAQACVGLWGGKVLGGRDCVSLDVTFAEDGFRPTRALHANGVYLVAGVGGVLASDDGLAWRRTLGDH